MSRTHLVIPDGQVKPNVNLEHWKWLGEFILETRPDVIVNLGDMADMPSLSSYSVGKKEFEGRRYVDDLTSVIEAHDHLLGPLFRLQSKQLYNKKKVYSPETHILCGNHEHRIERAVNLDRKLEGLISYDDLNYSKYYNSFHPYLEIVNVDGIQYSHYFTSGVMGNPCPSAATLVRQQCSSAVMGHVQKQEMWRHPKTNFTGIFAGIFYTHKEDYLGPQGNLVTPGVWLLHDVESGVFDPEFISVKRLEKYYA